MSYILRIHNPNHPAPARPIDRAIEPQRTAVIDRDREMHRRGSAPETGGYEAGGEAAVLAEGLAGGVEEGLGCVVVLFVFW